LTCFLSEYHCASPVFLLFCLTLGLSILYSFLLGPAIQTSGSSRDCRLDHFQVEEKAQQPFLQALLPTTLQITQFSFGSGPMNQTACNRCNKHHTHSTAKYLGYPVDINNRDRKNAPNREEHGPDHLSCFSNLGRACLVEVMWSDAANVIAPAKVNP